VLPEKLADAVLLLNEGAGWLMLNEGTGALELAKRLPPPIVTGREKTVAAGGAGMTTDMEVDDVALGVTGTPFTTMVVAVEGGEDAEDGGTAASSETDEGLTADEFVAVTFAAPRRRRRTLGVAVCDTVGPAAGCEALRGEMAAASGSAQNPEPSTTICREPGPA